MKYKKTFPKVKKYFISETLHKEIFQTLKMIKTLSDKNKYLRDSIHQQTILFFISGLLEILYSEEKIKYKEKNTQKLDSKATPSSLLEKSTLIYDFDKEALQMLDDTLNNTPKQELIETLIYSISISKKIWIKREYGNLLSKILIQKNGILSYFQVMIDEHINQQKYEKISIIICKKPKLMTLEEYYQNIGFQMINILKKEKNQNYVHCCIICIGKLITTNLELSRKYILNIIFLPFLQYLDYEKDKKIKESDISFSIETLHKLLTKNPSFEKIYLSVSAIIYPLFKLYCLLNKTTSFLKNACEEIIIIYFKMSRNPLMDIVYILNFERNFFESKEENDEYFIFKEVKNDIIKNQKNLEFMIDENGDVQLHEILNQSDNEKSLFYESECIINILKLMKNNQLSGDLFIYLISIYQKLKLENQIISKDKKKLKK
jgi:hypothetical protein